MPNKLIPFWQELKRRKVIRVMAMYAATAFIIMEAADIMLPRLGLPDWTVTFLIILLIAGFPITMILSWIFDITPEGVKRTESLEEESGLVATPPATNGRKIASNMIIIVLFVAVCILLYPKIFRADKFKELRDEDGRISVAVMPFDNLTGDSSLHFWQNGISESLINGLGNSEELAVMSSRAISEVLESQNQVHSASLTPTLARETARKIDAATYITGSFLGSGNDFSIMVNLENTESGELLWSSKVEGDLKGDFRPMLETLKDTIKNYLEIKALEESVSNDLSEAFPNSAEAYRHYIEGLNAIVDWNYQSAIESLLKAVEIDSSFTLAAFYLAFAYNSSRDFEKTYYWTQRAYDLKDLIPSKYHCWIDLWYACFVTENGNDIRRNLNLLEKSELKSRFALFDLGITYTDWLGEYEKGIQAYERIEQLNQDWGDDWKFNRYYVEYAWALVMAERFDEVDRVVEMGLKVDPENFAMLDIHRAGRSVRLEDSAAIEKHIENLRTAVKEYGGTDAYADYWIGRMYTFGRDSITAAEYFRRSYELDPEQLRSLYNLTMILLEYDIDIDEALRLTEIELKKNPEDEALIYYKGIALYKMGKYEEAYALLKEADEKIIGYSRHLEQYIKEVERALDL